MVYRQETNCWFYPELRIIAKSYRWCYQFSPRPALLMSFVFVNSLLKSLQLVTIVRLVKSENIKRCNSLRKLTGICNPFFHSDKTKFDVSQLITLPKCPKSTTLHLLLLSWNSNRLIYSLRIVYHHITLGDITTSQWRLVR